MASILAALSGKKTYIVVALFLACIGAEVGLGFDIPGFDPGTDWLAQVMGMLGIGALRAGVAK